MHHNGKSKHLDSFGCFHAHMLTTLVPLGSVFGLDVHMRLCVRSAAFLRTSGPLSYFPLHSFPLDPFHMSALVTVFHTAWIDVSSI